MEDRRTFFKGAVGAALMLTVAPKRSKASAEKDVLARYKKNLGDLKNVTDIQCSSGNWNYDSYMHGMANGLILALHIMTDSQEEIKYKDAPEVWLKDIPFDGTLPEAVSSSEEGGEIERGCSQKI